MVISYTTTAGSYIAVGRNRNIKFFFFYIHLKAHRYSKVPSLFRVETEVALLVTSS